jgi:hypothetical protein
MTKPQNSGAGIVSRRQAIGRVAGASLGIVSALKRRNPLVDYPLRIFALLGLSDWHTQMLGLPAGSSKQDLLKAIEPNTRASGELMGTYS